MRVEINGQPAGAEQLAYPAVTNYGHYTAMQVRNGATKGLQLHLARLQKASEELFDTGIDPDAVRDHIRHALDSAGTADASVRISAFRPEDDGELSILVAVRPPVGPSARPQRLMAVPYQRPLPHLKHAGSFGQIYYGRRANDRGFDDALLTGPDGVVSEAAVSNIAFCVGDTVIWPAAPSLAGTAMQLLEPRLPEAGVPTRRLPVRLADHPSWTGAFVSNSRGVAPVDRIDNLEVPVDVTLMKSVTEVYEAIPFDQI
jgi:branched-subunit amino acid aminotransferase/4-amino-4-deoxychorismate lyase